MIVPVWSLSLDPEIADDFTEFSDLDTVTLEAMIRIHARVIVNDEAEVIQGYGTVIAKRLLGHQSVAVYLEPPDTQMWGADFRGFEIRTGPMGEMRVV